MTLGGGGTKKRKIDSNNTEKKGRGFFSFLHANSRGYCEKEGEMGGFRIFLFLGQKGEGKRGTTGCLFSKALLFEKGKEKGASKRP